MEMRWDCNLENGFKKNYMGNWDFYNCILYGKNGGDLLPVFLFANGSTPYFPFFFLPNFFSLQFYLNPGLDSHLSPISSMKARSGIEFLSYHILVRDSVRNCAMDCSIPGRDLSKFVFLIIMVHPIFH